MSYNIKNHCVSCGKNFNNDIDHYMINGNYCTDCSVKCSLIGDLRKALKIPTNTKRIKDLLFKLKRYGIGLDYVLKSQGQIKEIKKLLVLTYGK